MFTVKFDETLAFPYLVIAKTGQIMGRYKAKRHADKKAAQLNFRRSR